MCSFIGDKWEGKCKEKEACQVVMTRAGMMIDAMGACRRIQNSLHN